MYKHTDGHTYRCTNILMDRNVDGQRDVWTGRQMVRHTDGQTERDRQMDKDRQLDEQTDRQMDR